MGCLKKNIMGCLKLDDGHWADGPTESCFGCLSLSLQSYKTGGKGMLCFLVKKFVMDFG